MRRPLVVVGPPTARGSEFAKYLSEQLGLPLVRSEPEALASHWAAEDPCIIDLCAEAWLDRDLRVDTMDRCVVVTVCDSSGHDGAEPRGFGETGEAKWWRAVAQIFNEAHLRVELEGGSLEQRAEEVVDVWRRDPVGVAAGERSYLVDVGRGICSERLSQWLQGSAVNLVVTDSNVERLCGEGIEKGLLRSGSRVVKAVFEAGEQQKHLETVAKICSVAQAGGIDRSSKLVAIGGGVVTDVGGFTAATWMRGIRWFGVSTTLLGMVDASVGGKTGVDFGAGKNAVGAFWQPSGVVCDSDWLATESDRNYRSALAEVVKTSIIGDPGLFEILEARSQDVLRRDQDLMGEVVRRCIRVKARVVGIDETERGIRATLNLGHTIGHALEAEGGYGSLAHGEAVSLGLVAALRVSCRLGFTSKRNLDRIVRLQEALELPVALDAAKLRAAAEIVGHDKKRSGSKLRFVVVEDIGRVSHRWLGVEDLREMMATL